MTAPSSTIASAILITLISLLVLRSFSERRSASSAVARSVLILLLPGRSAALPGDPQTLRRLDTRGKRNWPSPSRRLLRASTSRHDGAALMSKMTSVHSTLIARQR